MTASLFRLVSKFLGSQGLAAWALAALATLPPEWFATLRGLSYEQQIWVQLAWLPPLAWLQVLLWQRLGRLASLRPARGPLAAAAAYLALQPLLGLRLVPVCLLGLLPGLGLLVCFHPQTMQGFFWLALPLLAGLLPALVYFYRRMLAPGLILWKGLGAGSSLDQSPAFLRGKAKACLGLFAALGLADMVLSNLPSAFSQTPAYLAASALCYPASLILESALVVVLYKAFGPSQKPLKEVP